MTSLELLRQQGYIDILVTQETANELSPGLNRWRLKDAEYIYISDVGMPAERPELILKILRPIVGQRSTRDIFDAKHLAIHSHNGEEYFLTRDNNILSKATELKAFNISVMLPEQYLAMINGRIKNRLAALG